MYTPRQQSNLLRVKSHNWSVRRSVDNTDNAHLNLSITPNVLREHSDLSLFLFYVHGNFSEHARILH